MPSILGANTLSSGGYTVDNSCRFDGTAAYLNRTQGTSTNLTTEESLKTSNLKVKSKMLTDKKKLTKIRKRMNRKNSRSKNCLKIM